MIQVLTLCCILLIDPFPEQKDRLQIPPDHAQIDGIIVSLFDRNNTQWAFMKVTAIKGYGAGFRSSINRNDTIEVKLGFTLSEDHNIVSLNDSFSGNIKQGISGLNSSQTNTYEINDFTNFN